MAASDQQWFIIELNDAIEGLAYRDIEAAIITTFGDEADYFIPIHNEKMGSYTSTSTLMEGYAFIRDTDGIRENMQNLRESKIFSRVLVQSGRYQTISSAEIRGLRTKLKNSLKRKFSEGTKVKILGGIFKNLVGEVISVEDGGRRMMVKIKRISREMIAPIPATLLETVD